MAGVQPVKGAADGDALPRQRAAGPAGAPAGRARVRARALRLPGPCPPAHPSTAHKVCARPSPPPVEDPYLGHENL